MLPVADQSSSTHEFFQQTYPCAPVAQRRARGRIPDALGLVPVPGSEANVGPAAMLSTVDENGAIVAPLDAVDEQVVGLEDRLGLLDGVLHKLSLA